jgi:homoserine dehydrogenase
MLETTIGRLFIDLQKMARILSKGLERSISIPYHLAARPGSLIGSCFFFLRTARNKTTMSKPTSSRTVSVAVMGVGLVGSEFVRQLQALQPPHLFRLISLSSSKATVLNPDGIPSSADWRALLRAATSSSSGVSQPSRLADLTRTLASLVRSNNAVVLVDNTSSEDVAGAYPALLRAGVHVVTPNKKAFSGSRTLYDQIVSASLESGAKFLHESTVGAGLPVISTLKDLVATGDKVCLW